MNLVNKLKKRKMDNKGFSLVELIIVIAIMAILVGIVGTQVIPYINKSKEAKDFQIVNSYCTAAVTAYSSNVATCTDTKYVFDVYTTDATGVTGEGTTAHITTLRSEVVTLVGYADKNALQGQMGSDKGKTITNVVVTVDITKKKVVAQAYAGTTPVFDPVESKL